MKRNTVLVMIMGAFSAVNYANSAQIAPDLSADSISMATSVGMLGGKSKELVYNPSNAHKDSQLDWKIKNLAILKADFSWDAYSFLTLNARGWTSLAPGAGHMDDYDWMKSDQSHWTDHSSHPATEVNYANEYDLNAKGWFLQGDDYKVGAVAGYQETRFSWTASGGAYNYDNGATVGEFPNREASSGYSQRFSLPYIGLVGRYRINDFEFNALFKFSDWVRARDNDDHYIVNLTFRDKTSGSRYYGASVDAGYYVTRNAKVFTEFTYSQYEEGKGGTEEIDNLSGRSDSLDGDAAGISNKNYTVTVGLQYRF